jgi:predicted nucleic acid binding AN1-type Zn finger protein
MACSVCNEGDGFPYTCKFCSQEFCAEHRLPENHDCVGLKQWKETKSVDKLIYPATRETKQKVATSKIPVLSENTLKAGVVLFFVAALLIFVILR